MKKLANTNYKSCQRLAIVKAEFNLKEAACDISSVFIVTKLTTTLENSCTYKTQSYIPVLEVNDAEIVVVDEPAVGLRDKHKHAIVSANNS